jgi:hypothetical protein
MSQERTHAPNGKTESKTLSAWSIVSISLGSLFVLLTPLWIYMWHLAKNGISGNPDRWSQFGDFFGGVLGPVIALLSLAVTIVIAVRLYRIEKSYHHDQVKPYFTIAIRDFFSSDLSMLHPSLDADEYNYQPPEQPLPNRHNFNKSFSFKMSNKGLGIATEVVATFELNLKELKQLLSINNELLDLTASDIKKDEDKREFLILNIKSEHFNQQGWMKVLAKERRGYGIIANNKKFKVQIPNQIMTLFNFYNVKRKFGQPLDDFPIIFLTLNYKNIHGIELNSKFRVGLHHLEDYPKFSRFKLIAEPLE